MTPAAGENVEEHHSIKAVQNLACRSGGGSRDGKSPGDLWFLLLVTVEFIH